MDLNTLRLIGNKMNELLPDVQSEVDAMDERNFVARCDEIDCPCNRIELAKCIAIRDAKHIIFSH